MGKEQWFREFERLEAEHPEKTDEELADMARDATADRLADEVDKAMDEVKYGPCG